MSNKEKNCLNCRIHWDHAGGCSVCRWEDQDNPSLFYRITQSPETLAEKLVYKAICVAVNRTTYSCWKSTITEESYSTREEAIAATVAKLKEVKK